MASRQQNSSLPVMQVQSNNALANAIRLGTVETAVGVVAVVNPDGSGNSPDHPAPSDSFVTMYVTGQLSGRRPRAGLRDHADRRARSATTSRPIYTQGWMGQPASGFQRVPL
jgi:hypothetical protein